MPVTFINGSLPAVDFESITVSTVSIGITAAKLRVATELNARSAGQDASYVDIKRLDEAMFTVETNPVRFRMDGTDPTAAIGHLLNVGDSLVISGNQNLTKLRFIRQGAADGTVMATYYRKNQ